MRLTKIFFSIETPCLGAAVDWFELIISHSVVFRPSNLKVVKWDLCVLSCWSFGSHAKKKQVLRYPARMNLETMWIGMYTF